MLSQLTECIEKIDTRVEGECIYKDHTDIHSPPFEEWKPTSCGEVDISINSKGEWFYSSSKIARDGLIKLMSGVIIKEKDDYYLKTPAEKMKISVEDKPFVVIDWKKYHQNEEVIIAVKTNVDEWYELNDYFQLITEDKPNRACLSPCYVTIKRGLQARVHRNVYYQLIEFAQEIQEEGNTYYGIYSGKHLFLLG